MLTCLCQLPNIVQKLLLPLDWAVVPPNEDFYHNGAVVPLAGVVTKMDLLYHLLGPTLPHSMSVAIAAWVVGLVY